jgi:serine/threonine-protein kinase
MRQEVRVARQIAHPNVCRTYDLAEVEGQYFVVMEYVDGEDLASALRRLGRPAPDKALEIARQLCLGLGAAHENGVLHRDLKPANIMIDGRGRVRITDFGLAGNAEEVAAEAGPAGTPGYMAPEQEKSGGATIQSDIYSLGLVLYEIFTGRKASEMALPRDSGRPDSESGIRTPSSLVADIDPGVERAILRCIERDPARRIQSAYAVYGALPGGDPLAAALAAGETPSPELVASTGGEGTVRPVIAALGVAAVLAGLVAVSFLQRPLYEGFGLPAPVLTARAEENLVQATGRPAPRFSIRGYRYAPTPASGKQFWRRWSPIPFQSTDIHSQPSIGDPPQVYPGSATAVLDPEGRLLGLSIIPMLSDSAGTASTETSVDWTGLLRTAGRDPARAIPISPPADFRARADTLVAWKVSNTPGADTLIVAASFHRRAVEMETRVGEAFALQGGGSPSRRTNSRDRRGEFFDHQRASILWEHHPGVSQSESWPRRHPRRALRWNWRWASLPPFVHPLRKRS